MALLNSIGLLPIEAVLAALINNQSSKASLKLIQVADTENNYFEDKGLSLTKEEILRSLITTDSDGDFAIRYANISTTGSTKFNKSERSTDQILRHLIGKSDNGLPFIRLTFETL